ncbi:flavoprotein [Poriferisphaera sp. WC338]|uniref:flavoprotein n=1 Tax=Poriferisphaera sp. WC338 TaxID=3425129 RepID=UPI003D814233
MNDHPLSNSAEKCLAGKRVLVALTGGIACYKVCTLVSRLVQNDADVRVMMTEAATKFVGPMTFQSLSGNPVMTSLWDTGENPDAEHIGLARWCDLVVMAPASANSIAKMVHGIADSFVSTVMLAVPKETPMVIAPAMNADMWENAATQRNMSLLKELYPQVRLVGPEEGWQACRAVGYGRMSEPEDIVATCLSTL